MNSNHSPTRFKTHFKPGPVDAAIDHAFSLGALDMETLTDDIGTWFKDYSERSLVQVARG